MSIRSWRCAVIGAACTFLFACGGGGGGGEGPRQPADQSQTISFATQGTITGPVGGSVTNLASGGAGIGAITYQSSNSSVASVNSATGVASLLSAGTATITATKAASTGFLAATDSYTLNVTPGEQTITFAQPAPPNALIESTTTNTASGGSGAGAITYASSDATVVAVDPTTGTTTAMGVGTAVITATKAADANYQAAQASYTLHVQTADKISAWIGAADAVVSLPQSANGKRFARARIADCEIGDTVATCSDAALTPVSGPLISDSTQTLTTPSYYAIEHAGALGDPIEVSAQRFSERIGHAAVYFDSRYWVIGGASPVLPGTQPLAHSPQSDVWSSTDGRSWILETSTAAFGRRWFHQVLVYENALWLIGGGVAQLPIGTGNIFNQVWRSEDGVTWMQVSSSAPIDPTPADTFDMSPVFVSAAVFNGRMWIVVTGESYSSVDGVTWVPESAPNEIAAGAMREYATLTAFNGALYYIAGATNAAFNPSPPADHRTAVADVWRSLDGQAWTLLTSSAFPARFEHTAFVLGSRLWVMGGRPIDGTAPGAIIADAWSTADGTTWRQEATQTNIDESTLARVVEEPGRVTLVAGVQRSYSNKVWTTTNGSNWTERSPFGFSPRLMAKVIRFNGYLWSIGGSRMDSGTTNEIWRTADGINWTQVTPDAPVFSERDSHELVVFNDRLWVIGGRDFFDGSNGLASLKNDVWSSADGVAWQSHGAADFSPRANFATAVFNDRLWIIGGGAGSGGVNDVWSSADGETWRRESEGAAFSPRWGHSVLAFDGALWLIGGGTGALGAATGSDEIWRSTNGFNWTPVSSGARFAPRMQHAAVVHAGRMYVVGGASSESLYGAAHYGDVWSSDDGVTWDEVPADATFPERKMHSLVSHGAHLYVIGGYEIGRHHDVWRSSDGEHWRVGFSREIAAP